MTGKGTVADPRRPQFAPPPRAKGVPPFLVAGIAAIEDKSHGNFTQQIDGWG